MKIISSRFTDFFVEKAVSFFLLVTVLVAVLFATSKQTFLLGILIITSFLFITYLISWCFYFRKLQKVYLHQSSLVINNKEISFDKILMVRKLSLIPLYKISYKDDYNLKIIYFLPQFHFPFYTHSYIKEIKKGIKQNCS